MRTKIRWAELHSPLFQKAPGKIGQGVNLGQKLDPHQRQGLTLEFDEEKRHLYVSCNGTTSRTPETNIVAMIEGDADVAAEPLPLKAPVGKIEAQVEGPQSHVHAGPGKGQTGLGGRVK